MNIRMAIKLTSMGALIVAIGYLLRGHDILTGVALILLALFVSAKIVAAIIAFYALRFRYWLRRS